MAHKRREAGNLELIGGQLCLDFTNTYTHTETLHHEYLYSYPDLLTWSHHAGILSPDQVQVLGQKAAHAPITAEGVFERAVALRGIIYRIFSAAARRQTPAGADITSLNSWLTESPGQLQLLSAGEGFTWQWRQASDALEAMLWPIAWSAADLLTSTDFQRVRQCSNSSGCDWLFVDTSKNQSRRWCSMSLCGSQDKTRRYYQRRRSQSGQD